MVIRLSQRRVFQRKSTWISIFMKTPSLNKNPRSTRFHSYWQYVPKFADLQNLLSRLENQGTLRTDPRDGWAPPRSIDFLEVTELFDVNKLALGQALHYTKGTVPTTILPEKNFNPAHTCRGVDFCRWWSFLHNIRIFAGGDWPESEAEKLRVYQRTAQAEHKRMQRSGRVYSQPRYTTNELSGDRAGYKDITEAERHKKMDGDAEDFTQLLVGPMVSQIGIFRRPEGVIKPPVTDAKSFLSIPEPMENAVYMDMEIKNETFADIRGAEVRFINCLLSDVTFSGCDLRSVTFDQCDLEHVRFAGSKRHPRTWMTAARFSDTVFSGVYMANTMLDGAVFLRCRSSDWRLSRVMARGLLVSESRLRGVVAVKSSFSGSVLRASVMGFGEADGYGELGVATNPLHFDRMAWDTASRLEFTLAAVQMVMKSQGGRRSMGWLARLHGYDSLDEWFEAWRASGLEGTPPRR